VRRNNNMSENNNILNFSGYLESETIDGLINQLKEEKDKLNIPLVSFKKVIAIMIEAMENIFKYARYLEKNNIALPEQKPYFVIDKSNNRYFIRTGNALMKENIEGLKAKIDRIISLSDEQLKELYIETIRNGEFTSQGGAGLGFIKIARVCENDINYSFEPINEHLYYFHFNCSFKD